MRLCLSQSIKSILVLCFSVMFVGQTAASEPSCDALREAIRAVALQGRDTIASCSERSDVQELASIAKMAIEYRQGEIAETLLRVNDEIAIDSELVSYAALFDQPEILAYALAERPDLLEVRNDSGDTPLTSAALGRSYRSARVLLELGARVDVGKALAIAVSRATEIAYLIMEKRLDWQAEEGVAGDVLGAAIEYNYPPILQFILESGVSPNSRDPEGYHVLLHAPQHKVERVGEYNWGFMVRHGADEVAAICSLSSEEMDNAEEFAPDWYARKVSSVRNNCPPRN